MKGLSDTDASLSDLPVNLWMRWCGFKQGNIFDILKLVFFLHRQQRERRLLADVVRATFEGPNRRAGIDIAACTISIIGDPADFGLAASVLIDRDTARSSNKNLKEKMVYVNEYLWMNMYLLGRSGGL